MVAWSVFAVTFSNASVAPLMSRKTSRTPTFEPSSLDASGNCTAILPFAGDAKARFGHTALHNVVVGQKLACSIDGKGGADAGALRFGGSRCERGRRRFLGKRVAGHRRARDAVFA